MIVIKTRTAVSAILAVSLLVVAFLFWLIYFKEPTKTTFGWVEYLPYLNSTLNTLAASFIVLGILYIKSEQKKKHAICMIGATTASGLFLVSYIVYHNFHGDTPFMGEGFIRPIYFFVLISHILLSIVMVPMIFTTLFFAASKKFSAHKKLARWTYPIWIYVSITGVVIVAMLKICNYQA
jgi:putative membrane protein